MQNPYYNSNKRGIPTIGTTAVRTSDANVTSLVLPANTFLGKFYQGIIFIEIDQELPTETTNELCWR